MKVPVRGFLAILVLWVLTACECDDPKLDGSWPVLGGHYVGPAQKLPPDDELVPIPDSDQIDIDFGTIDAGTESRRYVYLRNTGDADMKLLDFQPHADLSPDFVLSCLRGGHFTTNCSGEPIVALAGEDVVIEVLYAPAEAGADTGSVSLTFNTRSHRVVKLNLKGQGVEPELQVCTKDCIGSEADSACSAAGEICNDQVQPDDLAVSFGDADLEAALERRITIRNLGGQALTLSAIEWASPPEAFSLEALQLPRNLAPQEEWPVVVRFQPKAIGAQASTLVIRSSDESESEVAVQVDGRGVAPLACAIPEEIDFGAVKLGDAPIRPIAIESCGTRPLRLDNLALTPTGSTAFSLLISYSTSLPQEIPVGGRVEAIVQYRPTQAGLDQSGVDYFSNSQGSAVGTGWTGTIGLRGTGINRVCDLVPTPSPVDFGSTEVSARKEMDVALQNVGEDPCTLTEVQLRGNSPDREFTLAYTPSGTTVVPPGQRIVISVAYQPVNLGQDAGLVVLAVDDKDGPEVPLALNGIGIPPAGDGPIAVCQVTPTATPPFQTVTWDGSGSHDTNGRPIVAYEWSVVSFPAGSGATLIGTGPTRTTVVDFAGPYTARLVVRNDLDQVSDPCEATTTVTPDRDLWIEMYWQYPLDDMDLHLIAPGGVRRTAQDCYFANCVPPNNLDWGAQGSNEDNPRLDLDDIPGDGPENINIKTPAPGRYTVFVHDYPGSVRYLANTVWVKVYLGGQLSQTFTNTITGEGQDWDVCTIDWPSGVVTPL